MRRVVAYAVAWVMVCVFMAQSVVAPHALASTLPEIVASAPERATCCDAGTCCCGGPDVCLCVAECPQAPLAPTQREAPARPMDERSLVATLPRGDWLGVEMVRTPRLGAVLAASPRVAASVRLQALVSVWLT